MMEFRSALETYIKQIQKKKVGSEVKGKKMEELYSIMRDFLEVEYAQDAFVCLLKAAEASYKDENQAEARMIAGSAGFYLNGVKRELKAAINRMDSYIAENAKKQS